MEKKKNKILLPTLFCSLAFVTVTTSSAILISTSCSTKNSNISNIPNLYNDELDGQMYIDPDKFANEGSFDIHEVSKTLGHNYSTNWYESLGDAGNWNYANPNDKIPLNLYCSTKKQALALYLCNAGEFWNVELHENKIPTDKKDYLVGQKQGAYLFGGEHLDIRGSDYKYVSDSLKDYSLPSNTVVYHGVEFMENEFYQQLEQYITKNSNGSYDYSKCVGQTIKSYGFLSTTFDRKMAEHFSSGYNWINGGIEPPLKESFIFKIYIPANIKGTAYVSYFDLMGVQNRDDQVLIDRNSEYKILKNYKVGNLNYFDLQFLGINNN